MESVNVTLGGLASLVILVLEDSMEQTALVYVLAHQISHVTMVLRVRDNANAKVATSTSQPALNAQAWDSGVQIADRVTARHWLERVISLRVNANVLLDMIFNFASGMYDCVRCHSGCAQCDASPVPGYCKVCSPGLHLDPTDHRKCIQDQTCPFAYYFNGTACSKCQAACGCVDDTAYCTDCYPNLSVNNRTTPTLTRISVILALLVVQHVVQLTTAIICLAPCPDGCQYKNGTCMDCNLCRDPLHKCMQCTEPGPGTCTRCASTHFNFNGYCFVSCPSGYYSDSGTCRKCFPDCATCTGSTFRHCSSCANSWDVLSATGACVDGLPTGQYKTVNQTWSACYSGCASCRGPRAGDCLSCENPTYTVSATGCAFNSNPGPVMTSPTPSPTPTPTPSDSPSPSWLVPLTVAGYAALATFALGAAGLCVARAYFRGRVRRAEQGQQRWFDAYMGALRLRRNTGLPMTSNMMTSNTMTSNVLASSGTPQGPKLVLDVYEELQEHVVEQSGPSTAMNTPMVGASEPAGGMVVWSPNAIYEPYSAGTRAAEAWEMDATNPFAPQHREDTRQTDRLTATATPSSSPSPSPSPPELRQPTMTMSVVPFESVLDFNSELDVALLDKIVQTFYTKTGPDQLRAQKIITEFQEHPDAWKRVDTILERSQYTQTKYIALQVLETLIKTMWKALPVEQQQGIKNYIVSVIIKTSSDEITLEKEKTFLGKLNIVLVQILKHEWPHNWPTFIPEIVNSSKTNLSLCENNMAILKLLSEEIFDFSAEQMTQKKTKDLKQQMCGEFSEIFQLCHEILEKAQKPSLIRATLGTLLRFLNWIPLGYIFETNLIDILRTRFLEAPVFRNVTLKCLTEIGGLQVGPEYNQKFVLLYNMVMDAVIKMIPINTDLVSVYENSSDDDQQFIQNLALSLCSFLSAHLKIVEQTGNKEALLTGHAYLLMISLVRDREIFKICLEYWTKLVSELYEEAQTLPNGHGVPDFGTPMPFGAPVPLAGMTGAPSVPTRKSIYTEVLSRLRVVMIERMVKPEEVLVVENDEGEIVREVVKESDTVTLYKSMREVLVYLTHLDTEDTEQIMSEKLSKQMDGTEWSWDNLNKLCWAIGSISGAMSEELEKRFLVTVIKDLLALCEMKRGKDNKAVVASNIMYIVGQYPRFLKAHWKFLKTVVNKNFEFMHEMHEGVQDMACDTFIKIAQKCKRHFVMQQPNEPQPYIEEILVTIDQITSDLSPQQVHTFYEAVGYLISAQPNLQIRERLIIKFMELPNAAWDNVLVLAHQNIEALNNPESIKILGNILKTNVSACISVGSPFIIQIARIYNDMLSLYKIVSQLTSQSVAAQGLIATKTPRVRGLRTIKKEILKLIETYVNKTDDEKGVANNLIPALLETVLGDYTRNVPDARDAEVLMVLATVVHRLQHHISDGVSLILDAVFECTLNMINKDFEEYPEHRVGFFTLLDAINSQCFEALIKLPAPQFKLFLDSIVWAFKHTMRDISDMGLSIMLALINNFSLKADPAVADAFFQTFYLSILQDIFFVLTNSFHKSGFKSQTAILMQMIALVNAGTVRVPLFDRNQFPDPSMDNKAFVKEYIIDLLRRAFPHLQSAQLRAFVSGLFTFDKDFTAFKSHVRDFLIQLKEFAGSEGDHLFLDEREAELEAKKQAERDRNLKIPGMLKPSQLPDDGMID
ncbi:hypothetical protein SeLEV6574_g00005 [Synchytrium endobioticum]|uniref:Importin N-terminal domain-containing protein n=1 Tax=Synchytrium endobioticum TaxID=286115 RepID=A0A507DLS0_9FUNG|nr:hypothetical protein SeLEV6574_g00005 [Synchytrium endobioticum]